MLANELMDFSFVVNRDNRKRSRRSMDAVAAVCMRQVGTERNGSTSQVSTHSTTSAKLLGAINTSAIANV